MPAKRPPTHPGVILREDVLPSLGLSVSEAARQLRVSRQTLHRILAGTSGVTPEMAVRLGYISPVSQDASAPLGDEQFAMSARPTQRPTGAGQGAVRYAGCPGLEIKPDSVSTLSSLVLIIDIRLLTTPCVSALA